MSGGQPLQPVKDERRALGRDHIFVLARRDHELKMEKKKHTLDKDFRLDV